MKAYVEKVCTNSIINIQLLFIVLVSNVTNSLALNSTVNIEIVFILQVSECTVLNESYG